MTDYLLIGLGLGISSGFAPGPLLVLVVSETLRYGLKAGLRVALAPLVSDLPVILLALLIVRELYEVSWGLGVIALVGGIFILITGIATLRRNVPKGDLGRPVSAHSLLKGVVANLLNPHPYLFWIGVGVPIMSKALSFGVASLAAFIICFYLGLLGALMSVAALVSRSRSFLEGAIYRGLLRLIGVLLCLFAMKLFYDGLKLLGLIGG